MAACRRFFILTENPFIPARNAVRTSTETQHKLFFFQVWWSIYIIGVKVVKVVQSTSAARSPVLTPASALQLCFSGRGRDDAVASLHAAGAIGLVEPPPPASLPPTPAPSHAPPARRSGPAVPLFEDQTSRIAPKNIQPVRGSPLFWGSRPGRAGAWLGAGGGVEASLCLAVFV